MQKISYSRKYRIPQLQKKRLRILNIEYLYHFQISSVSDLPLLKLSSFQNLLTVLKNLILTRLFLYSHCRLLVKIGVELSY